MPSLSNKSPMNLESIISDTQSLIRIDSQNPGIMEKACGEWVAKRIARFGATALSMNVIDQRDNLVVSLAGKGTAPRLILLGHLDTVPIGSGWSTPALGGEILQGKIYGRGACDMKGGVAIAINLLESILKNEFTPAGDVVFVATVDEEAPAMAGAHALVRSGFLRPDDQVIALEPTGTRLRIAQMGLRWLNIRVTGRMAHAGRAHLGIDSAHVMARIVDKLKTEVASLTHNDPILGRARFTCGTFNAGVATNVVPPTAEANFDIRIVPPMKIEEVIPMVEKICQFVVRDFSGATFDITPLGAPRPPVRAAESSIIVTKLRGAFKEITGAAIESGENDGHEAYTDASMIAALTGSNSCTVFGPGSTDQAHTADEFVTIEDLDLVSQVMWRVIQRW